MGHDWYTRQTGWMRVRLIGYWRSEDDDRWPDPRDLIDESWSYEERDLVASYFEEGFVPWVFHGSSDCRLCGRANGSAEFTDGIYLWPAGLAHYVRAHSVKLPDEVLVHVRRQHVRRQCDEFDSFDVERDWWLKVTSA